MSLKNNESDQNNVQQLLEEMKSVSGKFEWKLV